MNWLTTFVNSSLSLQLRSKLHLRLFAIRLNTSAVNRHPNYINVEVNLP
ncbi:MAG: hypothetical protein ACTS4Y_00945 [Candidatus Hodgkinia cicadicola]